MQIKISVEELKQYISVIDKLMEVQIILMNLEKNIEIQKFDENTDTFVCEDENLNKELEQKLSDFDDLISK